MGQPEITDSTKMWFGKYQGIALANVPADYLLYLYNSGKVFGGLKKYIEDNLDVLEKENSEIKSKYRKDG